MEIYKKLLEVKKKVPYIQKDKKSYQYSYATPSAVLGTLNPLLNKVGVILKTEVISAVSHRVLVKTKEDKAKTVRANDSKGIVEHKEFLDVYETLYDLHLRFTWVDVETGEKDENLFFASGLNGDEKGVGSALTYGERYFMLKYFNIPTDDDDPDSFQQKHESEEEKRVKEEAVKLASQQAEEKAAKDLQARKDNAKKCEDELRGCKTWGDFIVKYELLTTKQQEHFKVLMEELKLELTKK